MATKETITLRNVKFHFANLADKPRKGLSPKLQWDVKVEFPKEQLAAVKALGVNIKKEVDDETEAVMYSFRASQTYMNPKTGELFMKPTVVDANNRRMKGSEIGNGSEGMIKISIFDYVFEGRPGKGANLIALKVTNLIEYVREEDPDFAVNEDDNHFGDDNGEY
jgi:hypothetical protein